MPPRYKYTIEELKEAFPDVPVEELDRRRTWFTRKFNRRGLVNWAPCIKLIQCQKPGCEEMSRRIIDLSDGGIMRYCDAHYAEWISAHPIK